MRGGGVNQHSPLFLLLAVELKTVLKTDLELETCM